MNLWLSFRILGIEKTKDKTVIKSAYAKKVQQYHPEEYPEEWKRYHDAYQSAMQYAKTGDYSIPEQKQCDIHADNLHIQEEDCRNKKDKLNDSKSLEYEELFEALEKNTSGTAWNKISIVNKLISKIEKRFWIRHSLWEDFFYYPEYHECREEKIMIRLLADLILNKRYSYSSFLFILSIWSELEEVLHMSGKTDELAIVQETLAQLKEQWQYKTKCSVKQKYG